MTRTLLAATFAAAIALAPHGARAITFDPAIAPLVVPLNTTVTATYTLSASPGFEFLGASGSALNDPWSFGFDACNADSSICTATQGFTAGAAPGPASADLSITECPSDVPPGTVAVCNAIPFTVAAEAISLLLEGAVALDFGEVPIGTTAVLDVPITIDTGYFTTGASGISALNPPFSFAFGDCGGLLTGPFSCTAEQSFTPTAPGVFTAELLIGACPDVLNGVCINAAYPITGTGVLAVAEVPEPAAIALLAPALLALGAVRRRKRVLF